MFIVVLQSGEDKVFSRFRESALDEEVGVVCANVEVTRCGRESLFEKVMGGGVLVSGSLNVGES